jgi:hypothetical protein
MDPETLRQTTQAIMSRSPGLSYGEAQDMATAVYTGQRGQQLKMQRQQAANQFLGQQSESDLALTAGGRYMGTPGIGADGEPDRRGAGSTGTWVFES